MTRNPGSEMEYLLLFAGFFLLLYGGHFLVRGSVALAHHFNVSRLVVGVVIVSLGTSAPELVVSLQAAFQGHPDIALGNVVGSNVSNIALVLALSAIVLPIGVKRDTIRIDMPVMLLASLLLFVMMLDGILVAWEGLLFVLFLAGFIFLSLRRSRKFQKKIQAKLPLPNYPLWISVLLVVLSSVALVFGANWLITGVTILARDFGISERVISITVIAFGTSLPELATSIIAAFQKESDISIGNIVGSNIFNIMGVLGITSVFHPIDVNPDILHFDIYWMLGISFLLFIFIIPLTKSILTRFKGAVLFAIYLLYVCLLFVNDVQS